MNFEKVLSALTECEARIKPALDSGIASGHLQHCLGMIATVRTWPTDHIGKAFRWLGFIQGVMYAHGMADIETLKSMNRTTAHYGDECPDAREGDTFFDMLSDFALNDNLCSTCTAKLVAPERT
jgi:hypothetical protein